MKYLLTLFLALLLNHLHAQYDTLSHRDYVDEYLKHLNKSNIPTHVLLDRNINLSGINEFKSDTTDTLNMLSFQLGYQELISSSYNEEDHISSNQIPQFLNTKLNNTIYVGVLNFNVNELDTNAITNGALNEIDHYLYDDTNSNISAYTTKKIVTASLLYTKISKGLVTFQWNDSLFFSNNSDTLITIEIDLKDDSGYRTVQLNGNSFEYYFNDTGKKICTIRMKFGNTYYYTVCVFEIEEQNWGILGDCNYMLNSCYEKITVTGETFNIVDYLNGTNNYDVSTKGDIHIFYSKNPRYNCSEKKLHKPVIFLDGFDPLNERGLCKIWNEYINVKEFAYMGEYLLNLGYDLIIIDYEYGGTHIETNAKMVIKAIETLYSSHSSTLEDDFIIIGPSMGGPVARVALSMAEAANKNLHVRTFINYDGPMKGANIPIGLQAYINLFIKNVYFSIAAGNSNKISKGIENIKTLLNSPAAQQLLIDHITWNDATKNVKCSNFKTIFDSKLSSTYHYPQNTRNVTIVSGSNNGSDNEYQTPQGLLFQYYRDRSVLMISPSLNHRAFTSPNFSNGVVMSIFTAPKLSLLTNLPVHRLTKKNAFKTSLSLDDLPGGTFGNFEIDPLKIIIQFLQNDVIITDKHWTGFLTNNSKACFIPTVSAVDYTDDEWIVDFSNRDLVCEGKTPFDKIYSQNIINEPHVKEFSNPNKINWFLREIKGGLHLDLPMNTTYNFGKGELEIPVDQDVIKVDVSTIEEIYKSIVIHGTAFINNNVATDYLTDPTPVVGSHYNVYIGGCHNKNITVKIEGQSSNNVAKIKIGDNSVNNTGALYVNSENTLEIDNYGLLEICNHSKLVVRKGGKLVFKAGAKIELNGNSAEIIIEDGGLLEISDNAIFTFTGSGQIKFIKNIQYDANNNMVYPSNIKAGTNSKFILEGANEDDVVLCVEGGEYAMPDDALELFSIKNGQVNLDDNCRLVVGSPFYMENVRITTPNNNGNDPMHRGLHLFGQDNVTIKNSTIKYGKTGIYAPLFYGGNLLNIDNLKVQDCIIGIQSKGAGLNITEAKMYDCKIGWLAEESYFDSKANQVTAYSPNINNSKGIEFKSYGSSSLRISDSYIYSFKTDGVQYLSGPSLSVKCSNIKTNTYGHGISFNGLSLNLSPKTSPYAGYNDLTNNIHALNIYSCDNLLLDGGKNKFTSITINNKLTDIKGYTSSYYYYNYLTNTVDAFAIPSNNNLWGANSIVADIPSNSNSSVFVDIQPNVSFSGISTPTYIPVYDNSPFNGSYGQDDCLPNIWNNNPLAPVRNTNNIISIHTNLYNNVLLNIAINDALYDMYVNNYYCNSITKLSEILTYEYPTNIIGDLTSQQSQSYDNEGNPIPLTTMSFENLELLKLAYSKMLEALGMALSSNEIEILRGQIVPYCLTKVLNTINHRLDILGTNNTPETYKERMNLTFDKSFLYRLAEDRSSAISILNDMSWLDTNDLKWRDYYICSFNKEDSSINNTINKAALFSDFEKCMKPTSNDTSGNYSFKPANYYLENKKVNELKVYPNPTKDNIQIDFFAKNNLNTKIEITDLVGKVLFSTTYYLMEGPNLFELNLPKFSDGIYLLKLHLNSNQKVLVEKLIIKH